MIKGSPTLLKTCGMIDMEMMEIDMVCTLIIRYRVCTQYVPTKK